MINTFLFLILRKSTYFYIPACDIGTEIVENNTCKSKYHIHLVTLGQKKISACITIDSKILTKLFDS